MRDLFTWSLNLGRWFGIQVRVHLFFVLFVVVLLFQYAYPKEGVGDLSLGLLVVGLLVLSVLLHEFGHCFAARWVGGQAEEIVLWPLGGLALVDASNTPRAQFYTTAGGPAVNLLICVGCAGLLGRHVLPLANPLSPVDPYQYDSAAMGVGAVAFKINWILLLFNLLPAFPLDGGRLLRCALWPSVGFGRATQIALTAANCSAIGLFLLALLSAHMGSDLTAPLLMLGVAIFIYVTAQRERQNLEAGMLFDDSVFGYDFSQGYTSLEKSVPKEERRSGFLRRWREQRAQRKRQRELARLREEERRTDEILAKLHEGGMEGLTEEERRFLHNVSARYRSRGRIKE